MRSVVFKVAVAAATLPLLTSCFFDIDLANRNYTLPTFDICPDGETLLFTTTEGSLYRYANGKNIRISREANEKFEWICCSRSSDEILAVRSASVPSQLSTILHGTSDCLSEIQAIDSGRIPVFSEDNAVVFFAKPDRWFRSRGFGGSFWTDWDIWAYSFSDHESHRLTHERFFSISNIEVSANLIWFSAVPQQLSAAAENIYRTDKSGAVEQVTSENNIQVLYPAISRDGKQIAFVSDRQRPCHYSLFTSSDLNMLQGASEIATGSRYIMRPAFGVNGTIYFLRAIAWGPGGQPYLQIARHSSHSGLQTIVAEAELGYP